MQPPAPTNNQAATTDYNTAYAEFGNVYDPQVADVKNQQTQLAQSAQVSQNQLDQARTNAFSNNSLTANARGLMYSGYTPAQNTAYTSNIYNPADQKLITNTQNQQQSLTEKIAAINQQRANDANSLVQNTQQAQAQAAKEAAAAARAGAKANLPSQAQIGSMISSGLAKVTGRDGYVAPEDYAQAYVDWINSGGNASSFNSQFGRYKNPNNGYYNYAITSALKRG